MAYLVIAGTTVPVLDGQAVKRIEKMGLSVRAADGTLRSSYSHEFRVWQVTTGLLTDAEAASLEDAATLGAHVSCSGDLLGETVTCEVEVGDSAYISVATDDGKGFMRTLTLTLRETGADDPAPLITDDTEWVL